MGTFLSNKGEEDLSLYQAGTKDLVDGISKCRKWIDPGTCNIKRLLGSLKSRTSALNSLRQVHDRSSRGGQLRMKKAVRISSVTCSISMERRMCIYDSVPNIYWLNFLLVMKWNNPREKLSSEGIRPGAGCCRFLAHGAALTQRTLLEAFCLRPKHFLLWR